MSSLSEQDHLNPNDPTYYAPRWLRERSEPRSPSSQESRSEPIRSVVSPPVSLDTQLEKAVSGALWHPLDPEVIHEPAELARELDRRAAVMTMAARAAVAIGISAVVALFFVIMMPASRQPDAGSTSGANLQSASVQSNERRACIRPARGRIEVRARRISDAAVVGPGQPARSARAIRTIRAIASAVPEMGSKAQRDQCIAIK
jgi:hypothetical protein